MPSATSLLTLYELIVKGTCTESGGSVKNIFNVFHFLSNTPGSGGDSDLSTAFLANVVTSWNAAFSVDYIEGSIVTRDVLNQTDLGTSIPATGLTGGVSGDRLPSYNSVAMLYRTGLRGKSFRGGKRFGPVAESDTTLDELNAGAVTRWGNLAADLVIPVTGASGVIYSPVVFSRLLSNLSLTPGTGVYAAVTAILLNKTIGTLLRRKERTVR